MVRRESLVLMAFLAKRDYLGSLVSQDQKVWMAYLACLVRKETRANQA